MALCWQALPFVTRQYHALTLALTSTVLLLVAPSRVAAAESLCDSSYQDCRTPLINLIRAENVGIDVGFWFMEDQRYVSELIARKNAGVPVRLIVDPTANPTYPLNATSLDSFARAGVPMVKSYGEAVSPLAMSKSAR